MITFSLEEKFKIYKFHNLDYWLNIYKESINNSSNKINNPKNIEEVAQNNASVYLDKNKNITNDFIVESFLDHIFSSEKDILNDISKGIYEEISEEDFKNYINLVFLQEKYFINKNELFTNEQLIIVLRCFENFHTHSSKYIDSSSALIINKNKEQNQNLYLNSSIITNIGLDYSLYNGGGFGREYSKVLKGISNQFRVDKKIYSIINLIKELIEKIKNNEKLNNLENYLWDKIVDKSNFLFLVDLIEKINNQSNNFTEDELKFIKENSQILSYSDKKIKENLKTNKLERTSQIYWFNGEDFDNLIPVPSVKVFSTLQVLRENINEKYKIKQIKTLELEKQELEKQTNTKDNNEKIKFLNKKIEKIDKEYPKFISRKIKSVNSNPQNVSEFLSMNQGKLERFYSFKLIKEKASIEERLFYKFDQKFFSYKIKTNMLSNNIKMFLQNRDLFSNLPNSVKLRIEKSLCVELSKKIISDLLTFKKDLLKNKIQYEELIKKENDGSKSLELFQKYLLDLITEDEKKELSKLLIFKYEDINSLNKNIKEELINNIWILL